MSTNTSHLKVGMAHLNSNLISRKTVSNLDRIRKMPARSRALIRRYGFTIAELLAVEGRYRRLEMGGTNN